MKTRILLVIGLCAAAAAAAAIVASTAGSRKAQVKWQGATHPFPVRGSKGNIEDIHDAALDWLARAEKQAEKLGEIAEAAVAKLAQGGKLYVAGNTGFCEDLHYRGGGLSGLVKWDRQWTNSDDVVLLGHFKENDTGLVWNRFDEFYRYIHVRRSHPMPTVVHFTSLKWPAHRRQFRMPDNDLWTGHLHRFDTAAPAGHTLRDRALGQFATLAMAWAFQGEMIAAATRKGKMLGTYSHDVEPGSGRWDASVRGKLFIKGYPVPAIPKGKLGKEYLQAVAGQIRQSSAARARQVRQAAGRLATAVRNGKMIWLVHSVRTFQSDCIPRDLPIVYLGYDWNMEMVAPRLPAGDVLVYVAAIKYPKEVVKQALARKLDCVVISLEQGPEDRRVIHIDSGWKSPDSILAIPEYPRKVLPTSSVVQTLQWYSLLAETAAACRAKKP